MAPLRAQGIHSHAEIILVIGRGIKLQRISVSHTERLSPPPLTDFFSRSTLPDHPFAGFKWWICSRKIVLEIHLLGKKINKNELKDLLCKLPSAPQ